MSVPFELVRSTVREDVPSPGTPVRVPQDGVGGSPGDGPYVMSQEVATAVNVAIHLDQPLLVTGEPGCGKTSLAWAVANQLGAQVLEFHTKSTSVARDLFYGFDTLRRFHDASAGIDEARDASRYVSYQALGEAFRSDSTQVVLVDEIDKAPRDFPNDLLHELDRKEFLVPEIAPPLRIRQKVRHFVLVTSNSERRLPMPFLRRCVYAHIEFPEEDMLRRIVDLHTARLAPDPSLVAVAVRRFLELRDVDGLVKKPATGELVAWLRVLQRMGVEETRLRELRLDQLPGLEVLVKLLEDRGLLGRAVSPR